MANKKKHSKLRDNTARVIDRGIGLGTRTKKRVGEAIGKIASDNYTTSDLADDIVAQSADFLGALTGTFGEAPQTPRVHILGDGNADLSGTIWFNEPVDVALITKRDLVGPVTQDAQKIIKTEMIAAADYELTDENNQALPAGGDIEMVKVTVKKAKVPAVAGYYRGYLTAQLASALAEIVVVRV